jgi:hypothetical protein
MNLLQLTTISIVTVGAHLAITELLSFYLYERSYDTLESWYSSLNTKQKTLYKPLFMCPTCMASIWGVPLYFLTGGSLLWFIPSIFAIAFTNTLFNKWVSN